jgi:hypothetical protein
MEPETDGKPMRESKLGGWILFLACLLLLSLGASSYHKLADTGLIAIRLSLILALSVLVIRERWQHRRDLPGGRGRPHDLGESVLRRFRRWYYDQ